jgi:hypothetical protein
MDKASPRITLLFILVHMPCLFACVLWDVILWLQFSWQDTIENVHFFKKGGWIVVYFKKRCSDLIFLIFGFAQGPGCVQNIFLIFNLMTRIHLC